jgi:DNA-binding NarL/FixJ family response regulator
MSIRILVADDSPFWREQLRAILEYDSDCIVFEARNGSEALEKSKWVRPDIAILDFWMPELDGLNAARELKMRMPELPILIITVDTSEFLEMAALQAGVSGVVSKTACLQVLSFVNRTLQTRAA